jgi:Xaa-Pro aminopeptidase
MKNPSSTIHLARVGYPKIGFPKEPRPELPESIFRQRLTRLRKEMKAAGFDAFVVYGDREHFANLAWLTNYDPRFEEALLVVRPTGTPVLIVGNEGMAYSQVAKLPVRRVLHQSFSLLGQPRGHSRDLTLELAEAGLNTAEVIGVAGWKSFGPEETAEPGGTFEIPEFIVQAIRRVGGKTSLVRNANLLFMHAETGLRMTFEPEQIAEFEWIATSNSESLLRGLRNLRAGMTEYEACAGLQTNGLPFSAHPVFVTGPRFARCFMPSPTSKIIRKGEPAMATCTYQGANTCRFGWIAKTKRDLPKGCGGYVENVAAPYFQSQVLWYEALRIGATGHDLHRAVRDLLDPLGWSLGLNIGHQIAMDEWTNSPIFEGSKLKVGSGMYFQCDYLPLTGGSEIGAYAEDGVIVADASLRAALKESFPKAWRRFQLRRKFMIEILGIALPDELLPMSNFPAAVTPFLLAPEHCLVRS